MQGLWAWGTYEDNWVKDSTTGEWKIIERTMIYPVSIFPLSWAFHIGRPTAITAC